MSKLKINIPVELDLGAVYSEDELSLLLFDGLLTKIHAESVKQKDRVSDDPLRGRIKCQIEFGELLKEYPGEKRLTKEFDKKFKALAEKDKSYERKGDGYDVLAEMDKEMNLTLLYERVRYHYSMLKFRHDIRKGK